MRVKQTDGDFVQKSGSLLLAAFNCIGVCCVSENDIFLRVHCRGHQFVDHKIYIYINRLHRLTYTQHEIRDNYRNKLTYCSVLHYLQNYVYPYVLFNSTNYLYLHPDLHLYVRCEINNLGTTISIDHYLRCLNPKK